MKGPQPCRDYPPNLSPRTRLVQVCIDVVVTVSLVAVAYGLAVIVAGRMVE